MPGADHRGVGAEVHSGLRLASVFVRAGLGYPELRIEQRVGAGTTAGDVVERMVGLARTLADSIPEPRVGPLGQFDLGSVYDTIMAEAVAGGSVLRSHLQVGGWCLAPQSPEAAAPFGPNRA